MQQSGILPALALAFLSLSMPSVHAQSLPSEPTKPPGQMAKEQEGCKLLPYEGDIPLSKLPYYVPGQPDLRGGVICHYRISPDLPLFTFHFLGSTDNSLGDIEITEEPSTTIVQTIEGSDWGMVSTASELEKNLLTPVDANFDGYKDLQILSNCGATGNCSYEFFLYDPAKNEFTRNKFLSDLGSPTFDAAKKQVTSSSNSSVADWESERYQYKNGQYTLIHREVSEWDRVKKTITVSTYELRNGKMELVNSESTPE